MWGSNAREAHPIFFHHVLTGVRRGARLYAVDPRRTSTAQWADAWLGIDVGSDISLANAIGREIIEAGLVNEAFVRARHHRLRRLRGVGEAVHAGPGRSRHRRAGRPHPAAGARLCPRRPGADLLDPRHHRAPQRGRQRVRADQPGPAHRPRGPVRLRAGPAARPEQRAGRRRHGGDPQQADRIPGRQDRLRRPGPVRGRLRHADTARARLAPVADVRGHGATASSPPATSSARTRCAPRPTPAGPASCWAGSSTSWCRTSSSPTRPRSPTWCCRPRPPGARPRAR